MSQKETELAGITSNISDAQEDAKYFEPDHPIQKVIRVTTLHHTHFGKHFLLKTHTFSQIICNKYVKEYKD